MDRRASKAPPILIANQHERLLACPACGGHFETPIDDGALSCAQCHESFESESGIPLMLWPRDPHDHSGVTANIKSFYEETPFPNYEAEDNVETLRKRG